MSPGDEIGPYRVVRLLGQGGMGFVYEVEHRLLGVHYALKAFTCARASGAFLEKRFLTEGKLLARLNHPRIVRVFDLAVDPAAGVPYFVMNLVLSPDGKPRTLEDLRRQGRVTEEEAALWYDELAQGLSYVHGKGVVHRDVKLENVLVDSNGHAILSDFGVSRIFAERLRRDLQTTATLVPGVADDALIMGTKVYLAPEIRFGEKATPASDWYALGVLMLRLLTGVWYGPGTDLPGLLAGFDRNWTDRLRPLLAIDPVRRHPYLPTRLGGFRLPRPRRSARRLKPLLYLSAACLALVLLGFTAGLLSSSSPPVSHSPEPSSPVSLFSPAPLVRDDPQSSAESPSAAPSEPPAAPSPAIPDAVPHGNSSDPSDAPLIPRYQYAGRTDIDSIDIPEGVRAIEEGAFIGSSLRTVRLPESLSVIDRYAFVACDNLELVEFSGPPPTVDSTAQTFPNGVDATFPSYWASLWQAVIDPETGRWMGLLMYPVD